MRQAYTIKRCTSVSWLTQLKENRIWWKIAEEKDNDKTDTYEALDVDPLAPAEVGAVLEGLAEEPDPETLAEAAALELEPEAEGVAVGVTDGVPLKVTPCKSHEDASAKGFFFFLWRPQ